MARTASALRDADVAAILDEVPCLRGEGGRTVERIAGGLTNLNVKVTFGDQSQRTVIARIATEDSALLAIDRAAEHLNSLAAAEAGVAPAVVCRSAEAGVLVVEWVPGRTFSVADIRDDANLPRIAAACRRLHDGPRFVGDFDMFQLQRRYLQIVTERGFRLPIGYLDLLPVFESIGRALAVHAPATVPCHNDLLAENLIDDGSRLWLIDFEYAGNNDAGFELGNLASESGLAVGQLTELVRLYRGRPDRMLVARARLLGLASKYGWTLWASIQDGVSTVDFDFWTWGMEKYERAVEEFASSDFDRLLEEVTADT
ncbi:MAG TPA: phosphotransferase [Kineosporiaceae bacterium]|nr:phosphotransferase [Kineosporiaceae bacterium]